MCARRQRGSWLGTAVAWALALASPAMGTEAPRWAGTASLWTGAGFDSNALRDFTRPGQGTPGDGYLFALGQAQGQVRAGPFQASGAWDVAGRKYLGLLEPRSVGEDSAWLSMQAELGLSFLERFSVGLAGYLRDRKGGGRDYTDAAVSGLFDFVPDRRVSFRARVSGKRFRYWPRFTYSHFGPEFAIEARWRIDRRHSVFASGSLHLRTYDAVANGRDGQPVSPAITRADSFVAAQVGYAFRGPFQLTVSYTYLDQSSNSFGETWRRHRLAATAGFQLPWELTLLTSLALQLAQYPDGVFLSPELQVLNDDETSSGLTVKLVKPLLPFLELDLRYALYVNYLPPNAGLDNEFLYIRNLVSLGVSVTLD